LSTTYFALTDYAPDRHTGYNRVFAAVKLFAISGVVKEIVVVFQIDCYVEILTRDFCI